MSGRTHPAIRAINFIHSAFVYLAMLLIVVMTIIITANVFMRYVLNSGLRWAEEVAKLLVVWFTYIAMAVGVKQGLHISLHLLPQTMPRWANRALDYLKHAIVIVIAAVMIMFGSRLVSITSSSIMPATEWPSYILYLILPLSGGLIILEALIDILGIDDSADRVELAFLQTGSGNAGSDESV